MYKIADRWMVGYYRNSVVLIDHYNERKSVYLSEYLSILLFALTNFEKEEGCLFLERQLNAAQDYEKIWELGSATLGQYLEQGDETVMNRKVKLMRTEVGNECDIPYKLSAPVSLTWIPTWKCNNRCIYCCVPKIAPGVQEHIIDDNVVNNQIASAIDAGVQELYIHGGEPLFFARSRIGEIISYARDNGVHVCLSTKNELTEEIVALIKEWRLDNVQLSLDTCDDMTAEKLGYTRGYLFSFEKSIQLLQDNNIPVTVNVVVTKENAEHISELLEYLIRKQVEKVTLSDYRCNKNHGNDLCATEKMKDEIDHKIKGYSTKIKISNGVGARAIYAKDRSVCDGGRESLVIFPNGKVGICDMLDEEKYYIGDLRQESIMEIWKGTRCEKLLTAPPQGKCKKCEHKEICHERGICFAKREVYGTDGPDMGCVECQK